MDLHDELSRTGYADAEAGWKPRHRRAPRPARQQMRAGDAARAVAAVSELRIFSGKLRCRIIALGGVEGIERDLLHRAGLARDDPECRCNAVTRKHGLHDEAAVVARPEARTDVTARIENNSARTKRGRLW